MCARRLKAEEALFPFIKKILSQSICEITYLNKKNKVLERCVEMCLFLQLNDWIEVLVVDVSVNSEEAL